MSAEAELQKAVFGQLNTELSVPVYSHGNVDDNFTGQYVVIGNDTFIEWDTDARTGFEATMTLHCWDNNNSNRSMIPVKMLMGEVYAALHRAEFGIVGYNLIGLDFEFSETMIDPDGLTRHGVQRFRAIMRKV